MTKLFFDGAVEPYNPGGHGGYGLFVERDGVPVYSGAAYMGQWPELSNNCAEYAGCIAALRYCLKHDISEATIYGDSNIVINQMAGLWGVKEGSYTPYAQEAWTLRHQLLGVSFIWIPREQNVTADALSKQAVTTMPRVVGFQLDGSLDLIPLPKPKRRRRTRHTTPRLTGTETENEIWDMFASHYGD